MPHSDHHHENLNHLIEDFPMVEIFFKGELEFVYPDKSFKRFMIIESGREGKFK